MATAVVPSGEARKRLSSKLKEFREDPDFAEPMLVGAHRRPEGIFVSLRQFEALLDRVDDQLAAREVRDVLARDTGQRKDLADAAQDLGFDAGELGLT